MNQEKGKGKIKQVNQNNELIKLLPDKDYIQNPILYSQISGDFSLMQTNIMLAIVKCMRDRIASHIEPGKGIVGPLISEKEMDGFVTVKIPISDLGVSSGQYNELELNAKKLMTMIVSYEYYKDGNKRRSYASLFPKIDFPKTVDITGKTRRDNYIEVRMMGDVAGMIFNSSNQYVEHIADIAKLCNSKRTPRLYVYLSAWRKTTSEVILKYNAVKEFIGMARYEKTDSNSKTTSENIKTIIDERPYKFFHRDVLKPAQVELEKLAYKGHVEFFFTYEPIYHGGKTRGVDPDQIKFTLRPREEASNIIDSKYVRMWDGFMEAVKYRDLGFYEACVSPCRLVDIIKTKENRRNKISAVIQMPNEWVRDQWREKWCILKTEWENAFGEVLLSPLLG